MDIDGYFKIKTIAFVSKIMCIDQSNIKYTQFVFSMFHLALWFLLEHMKICYSKSTVLFLFINMQWKG